MLALVTALLLFAADPAGFEARKERVRALLEQEDFSAALEQAKAINRERLDDIPSYQLMAAAHLGLGNYSDAEAAIQWMLDLRIGKADSQGWLLVAQFREVTGDLDGAIEAVNLAYGRLAPGQERDGRSLLAYAGHLHFVAGKLDLAERAVKEVLKDGASDPSALETLARVRLAQQRREEATGILRELVKLAPHPRCLLLLAEISGDYAAFERSSLSGKANRERVVYLAGPGRRPAEALQLARREAARRRDVYTLDGLAVALAASGESAEAHKVMRETLAVGTRDPDILAHAARMGVSAK